MQFKSIEIRQRLNRRTATQAFVIVVGILIAVCILLLMPRRESLPDFGQFAAGEERKTAFFGYLRPIVQTSNEELLELRQRLLALEPKALSARDRAWLEELASRYDVSANDLDAVTLLNELRVRIDIVPEALALAQAAKESGWGTSRFAREGNNLFGEWCFTEGCGLVPNNRAPGRTHEVRDFLAPKDSIESYLLNLNSHPAYSEFRSLRAKLRASEQALTGAALAAGLSRYSERGEAYVNEVRSLIRGNRLE